MLDLVAETATYLELGTAVQSEHIFAIVEGLCAADAICIDNGRAVNS